MKGHLKGAFSSLLKVSICDMRTSCTKKDLFLSILTSNIHENTLHHKEKYLCFALTTTTLIIDIYITSLAEI